LFFMKGGALASTVANAPVGDALMSMAKANPLYDGPGSVFDNPLYDATGGGGGSGPA
jgi:hypothetical protein